MNASKRTPQQAAFTAPAAARPGPLYRMLQRAGGLAASTSADGPQAAAIIQRRAAAMSAADRR